MAVLCARLGVILWFGVDMPFWDQWETPLDTIFRPWLEGTFSPRALIDQHNEHRIVFTHLLDLGLFVAAGGQWRVFPHLVISQLVFSLAALVTVRTVARTMRDDLRKVFLFFSAVVLSVPFGYEAILWSFISQMYICILLSVGGLALVSVSAPGSRRFWLGIAVLAASLGSFGGGAAACLAGAGVLVVRYSVVERSRAGQMGAVVLFVAAAISLLTTQRPEKHLALGAHSLSQFLSSMSRMLTVAENDVPYVTVVPVFLLLVRRLYLFVRGGDRLTGQEWFVFSVTAWLFGLAVLVAYARDGVAPRYLEFFVLLAPLNFAALCQFVEICPQWPVRWRAGIVLGWCAIQTCLLVDSLTFVMRLTRKWSGILHTEFGAVKSYVLTGDYRALQGTGEFPIPYPDAASLAKALDYVRESGILSSAIAADGKFFPYQGEIAVAVLIVAAGAMVPLLAAMLLGVKVLVRRAA